MELWSAFVIGLAGSLHCIGMCGPIAISLPVGESSRLAHLGGRAVYNIGRILTYALLGLGAGLVGQAVSFSGMQQWLSIGLGVLILLSVILPSKFGALLTGAKLHARLFEPFKRLWGKLFGRHSTGSLFTVGLLNGFLPCGLVYLALAGAITTGNPMTGAAYMALFGVGTFPVMLAMSLLGRMFGTGLKLKLRRLVPVVAIVLGLLFIMRGMSLGIPYISPKIDQTEQGETEVKCCH